jgi:hypothetical protein
MRLITWLTAILTGNSQPLTRKSRPDQQQTGSASVNRDTRTVNRDTTAALNATGDTVLQRVFAGCPDWPQ